MTDHPLITLIKAANYDLTSAKAKLSEVERQIAALNLDTALRPACDVCGLTFAGQAKLAEHRYLSHDGPDPEAWLAAEGLALEPETEAIA